MTDKKVPTIGRLLDQILRLRSKRHVACDEAVKRVHERFGGKETDLLASVDEATRAKVVAMLQADDDPPNAVAAVLQNFTAQAADIGRAMGVTGVAVPDLEPPATTPPPGESTTTDEIPEALRNPLPESRLKIGQRR